MSGFTDCWLEYVVITNLTDFKIVDNLTNNFYL